MKNILDKTNKEYIHSLIPKDRPDWKESWKEGYEIGKSIEPIQTPFQKKHGVKSEVEFRMAQAQKGKLTWKINMGLASIDDQIAGLKEAEKFNKDTGLNISCAHQLPKNIYGIPKDMRHDIPTALGFDLEEFKDWQKITTCSEIQPTFGDQHLGEPNSVFMTQGALKAGSSYQGMFCHFQWTIPGCPDDVWNINEILKAVGMVAAHYDDKIVVDSDIDDATPAFCLDTASGLAWAKIEQYLVTNLCGARYCMSFGNYASNLIHKAAMWVAASDAFGTEDQPGIGFIYHNTVDHWDHHIHANYGFQVPEALMAVLVERTYKTGATFLSVPITEKITIPTVPEMLDMTGACQRTEEAADAFEKLMDWTEVNELRDKTAALANQMFDNVMNGLKEAGVDIENPLEIMVVLKRLEPSRFETLFHPSIVQEGKKTVEPLMPSALWQQSSKQVTEIVDKWKDTEAGRQLKGRRICVNSADVHYFGAFVIVEVLRALGADVIDGGNNMEAMDVLDLADEYGVTDICISLHNGQAYDYTRLITKLASQRNKTYRFFAGGVLTSFLGEDCKEPVDVTKEVRGMGIYTSASVDELIMQIIKK